MFQMIVCACDVPMHFVASDFEFKNITLGWNRNLAGASAVKRQEYVFDSDGRDLYRRIFAKIN